MNAAARFATLALGLHFGEGGNHVCEDTASFEATLEKVIADIARCAPGANAATKRLLLASRFTPLPTLLDQAAEAFATAMRCPEGKEGVAAFLEKRKAAWVPPRNE